MSRLRPYQIQLVDSLKQAWREGFKSPCIVAPCGAGKSVIAAEIAKRTTWRGNRVLFLVHRRELCEQIERTFRSWDVVMPLCTIGMVQTVTRRLERQEAPALIITDENHHCLAKSYKRVYGHFSAARRVGITATPTRLNGGGLGDINDKLIEGPSVKWLIDNNYLAPFDYYSPTVADLSGVNMTHGDYDLDQTERVLCNHTIFGDVIRHYRQLSGGKKAICYCTSILHSRRMAEQFRAAGICAEHIDGNTPAVLRNSIISDFRRGSVQILCNVELISEGFDVPDCNTSILLRPTQSLTLHVQQSMRCMRFQPGKTAVIIDHVGNYTRHGLPDQSRQWTLEPNPKKIKKSGLARLRQCPKCFFTHEWADICPECDHVYPKSAHELQEAPDNTLQRIAGFQLNFTGPDTCNSMADLQKYAKDHGYKPGWAYFQAKARGII